MQVSAATAADERHAAPANPHDLPRLRSGRHFEDLLAVERLDTDLRAERGLGHRDVLRSEQVRACPFETRVCGDAKVDVQVAGNTAARSRSACAGDAQRRPVVDARRDVDGHRALIGAPTIAAAVLTAAFDHLSDPVTGGTGKGRHHLTKEGLADATDLALAAALATSDGERPRLGAGAATRLTSHVAAESDRHLRPENGAFEAQIEAHLDVLAAARHIRRPGPKWALAEEGVKKVAESRAEEVARAAPDTFALRSEQVVAASALGIAERLIGERCFFEPALGLGIPAARVGVVLTGELSIGALDLVFACVAIDAEDFVEIAGH